MSWVLIISLAVLGLVVVAFVVAKPEPSDPPDDIYTLY